MLPKYYVGEVEEVAVARILAKSQVVKQLMLMAARHVMLQLLIRKLLPHRVHHLAEGRPKHDLGALEEACMEGRRLNVPLVSVPD